MRVVLVVKTLQRQLMPRERVYVREMPLPVGAIEIVVGYFFLYAAVTTLLVLGLMFTGLDQVTALSAVIACVNNLGPGLGDVWASYAVISDLAKGMLCMAVLIGRFDLFAFVALLVRGYWRPT